MTQNKVLPWRNVSLGLNSIVLLWWDFKRAVDEQMYATLMSCISVFREAGINLPVLPHNKTG